jgi:hypothetical protein
VYTGICGPQKNDMAANWQISPLYILLLEIKKEKKQMKQSVSCGHLIPRMK